MKKHRLLALAMAAMMAMASVPVNVFAEEAFLEEEMVPGVEEIAADMTTEDPATESMIDAVSDVITDTDIDASAPYAFSEEVPDDGEDTFTEVLEFDLADPDVEFSADPAEDGSSADEETDGLEEGFAEAADLENMDPAESAADISDGVEIEDTFLEEDALTEGILEGESPFDEKNEMTDLLTEQTIDLEEASLTLGVDLNPWDNAPDLALDVPSTAEINEEDGAAYFKFTPSDDGYYMFSSTGEYDTEAYLYDDPDNAQSQLAYNDEGQNGSNFELIYELSAGQTYYYKAKYYDASRTGSFTVVLSKMITVTLDANGGSFTEYDDDDEAELPQITNFCRSDEYFLSYNNPHRKQYVFLGWAYEDDATQPMEWQNDDDFGDYLFKVTGDVTIYAVWKPIPTPTPITLNTTTNAVISTGGESAFFSFTPSQSGEYCFTSFGDIDTRAYLYDSEMRILGENDDGGNSFGQGDNQFRLLYTLTAGKTYYYEAKYYDNYDTGSFPVLLTKLVPITGIKAEIPQTVYVGQAYEIFSSIPFVLPMADGTQKTVQNWRKTSDIIDNTEVYGFSIVLENNDTYFLSAKYSDTKEYVRFFDYNQEPLTLRTGNVTVTIVNWDTNTVFTTQNVVISDTDPVAQAAAEKAAAEKAAAEKAAAEKAAAEKAAAEKAAAEKKAAADKAAAEKAAAEKAAAEKAAAEKAAAAKAAAEKAAAEKAAAEKKAKMTAEAKSTFALNVKKGTTVPLQVKKSTSKIVVKSIASFDKVTSVTSSNKKAVASAKISGKKLVLKAGKKTGTSTITVTTAYGAKTNFKVKVQKGKVIAKKITGVKKSLSLKKGKKISLAAETNPITAPDKIKYSLSKKKIIKISSKGAITALKKGKVTITISAGKAKKFKVKVTVK